MNTLSLGSRLVGVVVAALTVAYVIHLRGEVADLEGRLAAAGSAAAAPPLAAVVNVGAERVLSDAQRAAMVETLSKSDLGSPVWFATTPDNPEAAAFQKALQAVFEEAGWVVKGNGTVGFPMKPGVYIFAADENPPAYVDAVGDTFTAAGIALAFNGRAYRDYYARRKGEDPNWRGFDLADDQTFVVAIGRAPHAATPAPAP